MDYLFRFEQPLTRCPVCRSDTIATNALLTVSELISLPDIWYSRCLSCRSCFVNPPPSDGVVSRFRQSIDAGDRIWASSIDRYRHPAKRRYILTHRVNPVKKYLPPGARTLDIACGEGMFVRFMADEGFLAEGIDISSRSVEYGVRELQLQDRLHVSHWSDWRQKGQTYDLVTLWAILEHTREPEELIQCAADLLHGGGFLLIEAPAVDSLLFDAMNENFMGLTPPYPLFLFSIEGLEAMLGRNGFEVVEAYPMPSNRNFVSPPGAGPHIDYEEEIPDPSDSQTIFHLAEAVFDQIAQKKKIDATVQFICKLRG